MSILSKVLLSSLLTVAHMLDCQRPCFSESLAPHNSPLKAGVPCWLKLLAEQNEPHEQKHLKTCKRCRTGKHASYYPWRSNCMSNTYTLGPEVDMLINQTSLGAIWSPSLPVWCPNAHFRTAPAPDQINIYHIPNIVKFKKAMQSV